LPLLELGSRCALPEGQDPDDLIRARGSAAMQAVLDEALPLADMLWRREIENADLATPERRAGAEKRLMSCVHEIGEPKVREYYRTMMQERLKQLFAPVAARRAEPYQGRREAWGQNRFSPRPPFKPDRPGARPAWTPPVSEAVRRSMAGGAWRGRSTLRHGRGR
jgi:DNA primase